MAQGQILLLDENYGPAGVSVKIAVGVGVLVGLSAGVLVGSDAGRSVSGNTGVSSGEIGTREARAELILTRENPSRLFPVRPQVLPSKNKEETKLQADVFPRELGRQTKISSPAPDAPFTEKSALVER